MKHSFVSTAVTRVASAVSLKDRDAEVLYADYIEGKLSYLEITLEEIKGKNYRRIKNN